LAKQHLSNIDTALLRLEDPTNPMMITGAMVFKERLDYERLKTTIGCRMLGIKRFQQKVAWPRSIAGNPYWVDDPTFNIDDHVQRAILPQPGDQAVLQEVVSLLASMPLDLNKPPWQFHLVEEYGEGSALIGRIHHSIGDGMALVHVMLSLTDTDPDAPLSDGEIKIEARHSQEPLDAFFQPAIKSYNSTRRKVNSRLGKVFGLLNDPARRRELRRNGRAAAAELAKIVLDGADPKTAFTGKLSTHKRAAWSGPVPLEDVKLIRRRLGGTVNDVLLTAMTGGLRRYLCARGEETDGLSLRAVVPVNLRPAGKEGKLGNRMGAVFLTLPISIEDPVERLHQLETRMKGHKRSMMAPLMYGVLNGLGAAPKGLSNNVINSFGNRASLVMTNVKGPQQRLYMAGSPLEAMMFWVPSTGPLGVGVSILSYVGEVRLGVITDENLVPDPEAIITAFHDEFQSLLAAAQDVEEEISFKKMSDVLDETLSKLDAMIEEEVGDGGISFEE
jgi:WS/DGAT/MGAT family acyltransferase